MKRVRQTRRSMGLVNGYESRFRPLLDRCHSGLVNKKHDENGQTERCKDCLLLFAKCVTDRLLYDTLLAAIKHQPKIEKVALYARVSTKDGRQDTENQLIALREYCAKQDWEIAGEYVDHETGGTSKRSQFQRLFRDSRARRFDLVLFWSLDRLSREGVSATLNHLERLTATGVGWRSYTAVLSILATIAKQERVRRSERAAAAIAKLRHQGRTEHLGRPRRVLDRGKVHRMHAQGIPLRAIAAELGVSAMTVHRILATV